MKVLLVQPPVEDFYHTDMRTYPLGLLYLARNLEDICDVKLIDFRTKEKPKEKVSPFNELTDYYKPDTSSPFSLFKRYRRFGASDEKIRKKIEDEKPDVVCISSLFSAYSEEALNIAKITKEIDKNIVTVVGGTHPTVLPEEVLRMPFVDYVIRGEGETPLFKLVLSLKDGKKHNLKDIRGLCYRDGDELFVSPINIEKNLNTIPSRRLIDPDVYKIGKKRYTFILTTRGCPNSCAFCGKPPVPFRKKDKKVIEEELEECMEMGIEWVDFEDDMLTYDILHFRDIMKIFSDKNFTLSAMNGIYSETLSRDIIMDMIKAGFKKLNLSMVDITESVLTGQRRFKGKALLDVFPYLESTELLLEVHFIIGLPEQNLNHILDTVVFLSERRCLLGPSAFYLVPNSDLCASALGPDWREKTRYMRSSVLLPVNENLSRTAIFTIMKLVRFINFLKDTVDHIGSFHISDLYRIDTNINSNITGEIVTTLIREKRFIAYDREKRDFTYELCDKNVIEEFFKKIDGRAIKGYRTHSVVVF